MDNDMNVHKNNACKKYNNDTSDKSSMENYDNRYNNNDDLVWMKLHLKFRVQPIGHFVQISLYPNATFVIIFTCIIRSEEVSMNFHDGQLNNSRIVMLSWFTWLFHDCTSTIV